MGGTGHEVCVYIQTCQTLPQCKTLNSNKHTVCSILPLPNSSKQLCIDPLLSRHAFLRIQSNQCDWWLIHPNWWMMSGIWNQRPSGTAPPPRLPSVHHPRLICTNLINTLTETPGLFMETGIGDCCHALTHKHAHTPEQACCPDGPLIALMVAGTGWWLHLTQTLSLADTSNNPHTLLHTHSTKWVSHLLWGYVVIGGYFKYTSNCSLNDMIRLWSDSAPD